MGREGISETLYRGIAEQLKNISSNLIELNGNLRTQTKYLEIITRKYGGKKLFKRYFSNRYFEKHPER